MAKKKTARGAGVEGKSVSAIIREALESLGDPASPAKEVGEWVAAKYPALADKTEATSWGAYVSQARPKGEGKATSGRKSKAAEETTRITRSDLDNYRSLVGETDPKTVTAVLDWATSVGSLEAASKIAQAQAKINEATGGDEAASERLWEALALLT